MLRLRWIISVFRFIHKENTEQEFAIANYPKQNLGLAPRMKQIIAAKKRERDKEANAIKEARFHSYCFERVAAHKDETSSCTVKKTYRHHELRFLSDFLSPRGGLESTAAGADRGE